ncbi:MAG TPA: zinc-dependent metalloprotease family protein [Bacteroidia bacterium]|nr:zinc-dependent metalloprotease family protein [Bacteroidia bacterium]
MKSKLLLTLFFLTVFSKISLSKENGKELWNKSFTPSSGFTSKANAWASRYISFSLNMQDVKNYLSPSPHEKVSSLRNSSFVFSIPKPDGSFDDFKIIESPVMEDGLASAYPFIKTYAGQGITDPAATLRFDITQFGFHAMVISPNGTYFIDPPELNSDAACISYYKKNALKQDIEQQCLVDAQEEAGSLRNQNPNSPLKSINGELRTYRLALAADFEYTAFYGGTVAGALAGMVTTMNRINGVYEREFGIHMNLIANDTLLIYTTSADPYTNNNGSAMLGQNQTNIDNVIGSANYDIGHVFSTGGGGIAGLGVICEPGMKAWGVTGLGSPIGDGFDIDYVAHEMGHQFGGNHSFNSVSGFCNGNREAIAAYEPGSGSTIMGYAGICGSDDLQPHSDDYFHTKNFDEITVYTQNGTGNTCAAITTNSNSAPVLTIPANFTIPLNTPFRLVATATDPDLDSLTYCWEQFDLGPAGTWNNPSGNAPIFRSFNPVTTGTRLFPKLQNILNNNTTIGEIKASYARALHFRCTVRDNVLSAAGVTYNNTPVQVTVANTPGPFAVLSPNVTGITWLAGTLETITWSVNGSDVAPVSTPNVNVLLSLDGGNNFTITLGTNVPNNGSLNVTVPNVSTSTARVMVEGAGNIFFDINDKNFTINPLGVEENNFSNAVMIFPNPVKDMFELMVANEDLGDIDITITNAVGKVTGNYLVHKNENIVHLNFDFSKQAAGVYFVKLKNEKSEAVKRIVKF